MITNDDHRLLESLPLRSKSGLSPNYIRFIVERIKKLSNDKPPGNLWEISKFILDFRRQVVDQIVREHCHGVVQSGPFQGTKYLPQAVGALYAPKLLGTYEKELHPIIEEFGHYRQLIDVGCAEGYYAVGIARKFPHINVHAFDINEAARNMCRELADLNMVSSRIQIADRFSNEIFSRFSLDDTVFIIDIEGAEIELLSELDQNRLSRCDLLIETHMIRQKCTALPLIHRFSDTHDITVIWHQPRDYSQFAFLKGLGELDRFFALWEGRTPAPWLMLRAF